MLSRPYGTLYFLWLLIPSHKWLGYYQQVPDGTIKNLSSDLCLPASNLRVLGNFEPSRRILTLLVSALKIPVHWKTAKGSKIAPRPWATRSLELFPTVSVKKLKKILLPDCACLMGACAG